MAVNNNNMEGHWRKMAGMKSDLVVKVGSTVFNVHKYPLYAKSDYFSEVAEEGGSCPTIDLTGLPGGEETFILLAHFCYGIEFDVTPENVAALRCAAVYTDMLDDSRGGMMKQGNLASMALLHLTQFLQQWDSALVVLRSCEKLPRSIPEANNILARAIDGITTLIIQSQDTGADMPSKDLHVVEEISELRLDMFVQLIENLKGKGLSDEETVRSIDTYARRRLPNMKEDRLLSEDIYANRTQWQEVVEALVSAYPEKRSMLSMASLLYLLRVAIFLNASKETKSKLYKMAGQMLDQATLEDLLHLEVQDVLGLLQAFTSVEHMQSFTDPIPAVKSAAQLIDAYMKEAVTGNLGLNFLSFRALAQALPKEARPSHDGLYIALVAFLTEAAKKPPYLTNTEIVKLTNLIDPPRLSEELAEDAPSNDLLPIEFKTDVLFWQKKVLREKVDLIQSTQDQMIEEKDMALEEVVSLKETLDQIKANIQSVSYAYAKMEAALKEDNQALRRDLEQAKTRGLELTMQIANATLERDALSSRTSRSSRRAM